MNSEEKEILKKISQDFLISEKEYYNFSANQSAQLIFAQFRQFNSIGSIGIALIILGIGNDFLNLDILSITSLISLLLLIIYSNSYIKEVIDKLSINLESGEEIIKDQTQKSLNKIIESFEGDDYGLFNKYAKEQLEKSEAKIKKPIPIYAGEIVNFLLFEGVISGIVSIFFKYQTVFSIYSLFILIFICSFFLSFFGWSNFITEKISIFFELIKRYFIKLWQ
jgi:hypothetical protein